MSKKVSPPGEQIQPRDAETPHREGNGWIRTGCPNCGTKNWSSGSRCRKCGKFFLPVDITRRGLNQPPRPTTTSGASDTKSSAHRDVVLGSERAGSSQVGGGISDPPASKPTSTEDSAVGAPNISARDVNLYKDQASDRRVPNSRQDINETARPQPFATPHTVDKNTSDNKEVLLPWAQKDGSGTKNVLLAWTDPNVSPSPVEQPKETTKGVLAPEASLACLLPRGNSASESISVVQSRPRDEILDKHISLIRSSPIQETSAEKSQRPLEWDCGSCGQTNYMQHRTCRRCNSPRPLTIRHSPVSGSPSVIRSIRLDSQRLNHPGSVDTPNASDESPTHYWKHVRKRQRTGQGESAIDEPGSKGQDARRNSKETWLEDIDVQRSERLRVSSNGRFVGFRGVRKYESGNRESPEKLNTDEVYNPMKSLVLPLDRDNHQTMETAPKETVQLTSSPTAWAKWKSPMQEVSSPTLDTTPGPIEPTVAYEEPTKVNDTPLDTEPNRSDSVAGTLYPKAADIDQTSGGWAVWKPPVVEQAEPTSSQSRELDSSPSAREHELNYEYVNSDLPRDESVSPDRLATSSSTSLKPPVLEPKLDYLPEAGKASSSLRIGKGPYPTGIVEKPTTVPAFKVWRPTGGEASTPSVSMPGNATETQMRHGGNSTNQDLTTDSKGFVKWCPAVSTPESISVPRPPSAEDTHSLEEKDPVIDMRAARRAARFLEESEQDGSRPEQTTAGNSRNWERGRSRRDQQYINDYEDEEDLALARAERKKQRKRDRVAQKAAAPPTPIILPEFISIGNLASALRLRIEDFVERMESLGFEETNSDYVLDAETAGLIATEFNYDPIIDRGEAEDLVARPPAEDKSLLPPRPPVVTIMGHVDHGKTTLLDWLRKSSVAASEHGGITQHIGAFTVSMPSGKIITFLDTPGHAAFLSMRQRGANVTDIVILVVAADDSVKPQTVEAIKHAQAAKVPMIVAINKIDKEGSNIERVKQDLARHSVDVEDFGGDTQVVCVSGKTGQGMDELEDATIALADVLDMRAETDGQAEGWVLEATTKKAGRVATVLVRRGTIYPGSVIVAGSTWAKVRTLKNEAGVQIDAAGPGTPVEVDGWREQPEAGDEVLEAPDEQKAKAVIDLRLERAETTQMAADMVAVNEARRMEQEKRELGGRATDDQDAEHVDTAAGIKEVFFIIKGDVSGSVEAVLNSVSALGNQEVRPHVLRSAVGPVGEFDVEHAAVAKGHIISFNTPVDPNIARMAEAAGVSILDHNIIYRLVDDVKAKLSEQLAPSITSRVLGEAEIAQVFDINTKGRITVSIAGCRVRNGVLSKNGKVRVLRDRAVIYDGLCLQPATNGHLLNLNARFTLITQEPEERCHGNAQGERVRSGVRGLYGFQGRGPGTVLRREG